MVSIKRMTQHTDLLCDNFFEGVFESNASSNLVRAIIMPEIARCAFFYFLIFLWAFVSVIQGCPKSAGNSSELKRFLNGAREFCIEERRDEDMYCEDTASNTDQKDISGWGDVAY